MQESRQEEARQLRADCGAGVSRQEEAAEGRLQGRGQGRGLGKGQVARGAGGSEGKSDKGGSW